MGYLCEQTQVGQGDASENEPKDIALQPGPLTHPPSSCPAEGAFSELSPACGMDGKAQVQKRWGWSQVVDKPHLTLPSFYGGLLPGPTEELGGNHPGAFLDLGLGA